MFKFFKEKLQGLFGKKEEKVEEAEAIEETKKDEKKLKKEAKKREKKEKVGRVIEELEEKIEEKQEKELKKEKVEEEKLNEEKIEIKKEEKVEDKKGFFERIQSKFNTVKLDESTFNEFFERLEMLLLENNVALEVVDKIKLDMEKKLLNIEIKKDKLEEEIKNTLRESILEILIEPFDIIERIKEKKDGPFIILFFGINGCGKTTSIAKIADKLNKNNISCVLAAADTFRAASIEQLKKHGDKLGVKVINQTYGSDPTAVAYDAISYAKAHQIKVVLIDTAGRMHTKENLLKEMEKIVRVTQPDLKIFVAESITGNDATEQAKSFNEIANIDGTILTKADVDEKGGTAISIGYVTSKPILYLGTGQEYKDLTLFDPKEIIVNLGLD
ncbi:MAG TPA: signal recognition particle-docking protein FtsY [Candidatus Paceibacterota bacterium]|nr:signal recognition particle-docking protein FtsY [Candidatus Paceibacterota bacterium]